MGSIRKLQSPLQIGDFVFWSGKLEKYNEGNFMKHSILFLASSFIIILLLGCQSHPGSQKSKITFNYSKFISDKAATFFAYVKSVDYDTGKVIIAGGNKRESVTSFSWQWGDGSVQDGLFPQEHVYADLTKNYSIRVISQYSEDESDTAELFIRFTAPVIIQKALPANITVSIPDSMVTLESRMPKVEMYEFSKELACFGDQFFPIIPRTTIEYILSMAAAIQMDLVNDNVYMDDGTFRQIMLRDAGFGGMYSLWYTNPVSFGVGDWGFRGAIQWSSFFHEMGHNFTLNTPADYYFGGKTDGFANAIYSEAMAQIFQHVTAYCIVNNYRDYGLGEDLANEIRLSAQASFLWLSKSYQRYVDSGRNFASWNGPDTPQDETSDTFMTVAYKFFEQAEQNKADYKSTLKRMMKFLQHFNSDWHHRFDPENNSDEGAAFRATLMVAALSYAFDEDLVPEFRELHFPINEEVFQELMAVIK